MKTLYILNPESGGGGALQKWQKVQELLDSFGVEHFLLSNKNLPLDELLCSTIQKTEPDDFNAIIGIGGDGTHSALLNAIIRYHFEHPGRKLPPYAFIPVGTGNDIAKSLGLDVRPEFLVGDLRRAVATAIHGADYMMDAGLYNNRYFLDALTIGLDSQILKLRNLHVARFKRFSITRWLVKGYFLYALAVLPRFLEQKKIQAQITVDDDLWYSGPLVNLIVNNTRVYGGNFVFCPETYASDGLLDIVVFTDRMDYLLKCLLALRTNPTRVRAMYEDIAATVRHVQGKKIKIQLSEPETVQVDGEILEANDTINISVVPDAVHVKTPVEPE
ncbi:MAG: hypothetical protein GX811_09065 [Lentisphaerae bacterium]|nr:hypothetical protein [Lentisphaerota bacterium]